jgi:hypothetical protein
MYDLGAVVFVDGDDLGGVADGARRQLCVQNLEQHVSPDAAEFSGSSSSASTISKRACVLG